MKKAGRALAGILVASLVLGITACSGKSNSVGSHDSSSGIASTQTVGEVDIWGAYSEPVTLTTVLTANPACVFYEGEDYSNNPWYDRFSELFNIDVENIWVAETSADYTTKLNLAIADGSLPDVFLVGSIGTFNQLVDAGVAMDITEVFEAYASDTVKSYMEVDPITTQTAYRDGRMYGIPQLTYGVIDQVNQVWIRKDWKEEQNLPDPKTMDDLVEIARVFNEKYGAVGIGEDQNLESMNILAPAWGAYPGVWLETENGIEYGSVQPEMKTVLETFADWYKEGLLYEEFITSDMTKMQETNITGQVGIQPFYQWLAWTEIDVVKNLGENAYFQAYEIPSAIGEPVKTPIKFSNYGYIVINKNCKNPEAALKLINYYAKTQFEGDEDPVVLEELARVGAIIPYAFRVFDPNNDYQQYVDIQDAVEARDPSNLIGNATIGKYNNIIKYLDTKEPDAIGDYMQVGDEKCAYSVSKKVLDEGNTFKDVLWGVSPQSLTDTGSTLDDILKQGFTQIIVGEKPVDYFDELVESWKTAGGEAVTSEMNEIYG